MTPAPATTDVVIAGAGPVGLLLATDLGRRGIPCVLLEREASTAPWPKMDRCNARTMEFFRRMGIAEPVRALGYPADNPMDVFICTQLAAEPLVVLRHPSVAEARAAIAGCRDGSLPLEPYQLVSQNKLEPLLKDIAEATPNVTVRYGCALEDFTQDLTGVSVTTRTLEGDVQTLRCAYLVGADGGRSTVRKGLGVPLQGDGGLAHVVQVIFSSDDLYERIPMGRGRHYVFVDDGASTLVAQGDRKEFTLHSSLPPDTDFEPVIRELVGFDFSFDIRHIVPWRYNLLVAQRYREGRVFLAGDSAHLVIPTGGLGMNTGVGDALDLSWKLAGMLTGWGGEALLHSYEAERRPVGLRNRQASAWAAENVMIWRKLVQPGVPLDSEFTAAAGFHQNRMHVMRGAELGYSYAGSPVIATEPGGAEDWDTVVYSPSARPGARIPHMWLRDGRAVQDVLGADWTLLDLRGGDAGSASDLDSLVAAFDEVGASLDVVRLDEADLVKVYEASLLLLRPDLHVAWRGFAAPENAVRLTRLVTGYGTPAESSVEALVAVAGSAS